ncbi:MAG: winged helix-turn-helix domain-containing protein [Archaeoglobaceae archaeon]
MKSGSLATNPNKLKLIEMIAKKEQGIEEISKKTRIPVNTAKALLEELMNEGLILKEGNVYKLTEKGEKAIKEIKNVGGKGR